MVAYLKFNLC